MPIVIEYRSKLNLLPELIATTKQRRRNALTTEIGLTDHECVRNDAAERESRLNSKSDNERQNNYQEER